MKTRYGIIIVTLLSLLVFAFGCGANDAPQNQTENENSIEREIVSQDNKTNYTNDKENGSEDKKANEDASSDSISSGTNEIAAPEGLLPPNEAGQIMVLMYHRFGDTESTWQRTWDNFRSDLERLYQEGYRLISIKDYLNNTIAIPAGYSPVILTFDDGYSNQFSVEKNGDEWVLRPQTAAGIMYEFYQEHPDFGLEGIFYVNSQPFNGGNWKYAVEYLVYELGMDIGSHTRTHINMQQHGTARIIEELGGLVKDFKEVLPDYEIDSLALPYGVYPSSADVFSGEYEGVKYENKGVLLVGANPAPAPIAKSYNPLRIPRIRGDEENLNKWLDYFAENPHLRYVSDGDLEKLTVPSDMLHILGQKAFEDKRLQVYYRGEDNGF
ncbi:polysaccharide deacetylase family protein [Desulfitibacter alkalitolerans]|uniref:polysaccharide deacetylase family protein n=1 Tax=Desulfitibacter alkalitolerans TaxID=264641 RepID=UPI0006848E45|nr:polysaccharide deacetylase family protein [Desulfitibacter alkalitolerans]